MGKKKKRVGVRGSTERDQITVADAKPSRAPVSKRIERNASRTHPQRGRCSATKRKLEVAKGGGGGGCDVPGQVDMRED